MSLHGQRNDGATMPTQGTFAPTVIDQLRTIINPVRERFGFGFTMEKWADLVQRDRRQHAARTRNKKLRRGRPYDDPGRFSALLLAVIFEEYTGKRPARTTRASDDTKLRDKDYPFYKFGRTACDAAGIDTTDRAFVEAINELSGRGDWEANIPALRKLLWGELRMADAEYEQVRRHFSMALDAVAEGKLLSDVVSPGLPVPITVSSALIDAAVHLREPLDDETLDRAGRALDRFGINRAAISAMRKDEIGENFLRALSLEAVD
jgi:hypothetical protein